MRIGAGPLHAPAFEGGAARRALRAGALVLAALLGASAQACTGQLIAFRGLEDAFDSAAFERYSRHAGMCSQVFGHDEVRQAVASIRFEEPYMLYGFSAGASSARRVIEHAVKTGRPRPVFVLTIAAARKADVDFRRFGVAFHNYYDSTSRGNKAPGTMLPGIDHFAMQQAVNRLLGVP